MNIINEVKKYVLEQIEQKADNAFMISDFVLEESKKVRK